MVNEIPKIKKPDEEENHIPPQYEGLPSEVVEELWNSKKYVDPKKTETENIRREKAIQQIKDQEEANKIREKIGIPKHEIGDKNSLLSKEKSEEKNENFDFVIRNEYCKYAKEYYIKIQKTTEQEAEELIKRSENLDNTALAKGTIEKMYFLIRLHDYKQDENYDDKIEEITKTSTDKINSHSENGWHYRVPYYEKDGAKYYKTNKAGFRISLNVNADNRLIESLDNYISSISTKPGSIYYKTPENSSDWLERHDPITIYFEDDVPDDIKEKIINITKPFIRSKEDVLPGEKLSEGVAYETSPSIEKLQELIERGYAINQESGEAIEKYITKDDRLKASAGQVSAIEKYLNNFEE